MPFKNIKEIVDEGYTAGKNWHSVYRKVPVFATVLGVWFDISFAPGIPRPNYKVGAELTATYFNGEYGIYHGNPITDDGYKFLHKFTVGSASALLMPATFILCDYLMFYPLIDMDSTDTQVFKPAAPTTPTPLPRYVDGDGVKAFLVATNPYVGGMQFQMTYTNQDGTTGRVSEWTTTNTSTYIATIVNSGVGATLRAPWIQLQTGDRGIRNVRDITFANPNGGLATLILAKPLATIVCTDVQTVAETDFLINTPSLPRIYDGAFLSLICMPNGSAAAVPVFGDITTIWR
jgi:hypothetical protein